MIRLTRHFHVSDKGKRLIIKSVTPSAVTPVALYLDYQPVATFWNGSDFHLSTAGLSSGYHVLTVVGQRFENGSLQPITENFSFFHGDSSESRLHEQDRIRDFRAGDILVASDNENDEKTGYVGHSAIVISPYELIESPGGHPAIVKDGIRQYLESHRAHAQYRPKSPLMGENAAAFARSYLAQYRENLKNGIKLPKFSYSIEAVQGLDDPWKLIYCSKLVWLCYHYGANYTFPNDFLWFSPQDLFEILKADPNFIEIYRSPHINFLLDT